jgi:hypothetical protein
MRQNIDTPNTQIHDNSLSWLGTGTSIKSGRPNTQIHDNSLSWLGTGTSIKSGRIKLVLWANRFHKGWDILNAIVNYTYKVCKKQLNDLPGRRTYITYYIIKVVLINSTHNDIRTI